MRFVLGEGAGRGWLSLLKRLETHVSLTRGTTPLSKMTESLKYLTVKQGASLIIDVPLASSIQMFRNLINLDIPDFHDRGEGQCTFKLDNDCVTELAMALPQLESLVFGYPCEKNTCATTVACLLQISVHCIKLKKLGIHFSATNIVEDLKSLSEDSQFRELRSLPRCTLRRSDLNLMPLTVYGPGRRAVVDGMISIFPSWTS